MSSKLSSQDESLNSTIPSRYFNPIWTLTILASLIFLAELVSMTVLYFVQLPNYVLITLLDAIFMIILILPALYFLQLRPLLNRIEERIQAEQSLRASENLLSKVLELLPAGVWIVDKSGVILRDNPASQDIWAGARYASIQEYSEYKGWWPDTGKRIELEEWAAARAIFQGEISLNEEVNIEAFDGTKKVILNSALPILDSEDSIQGAVVVNQDITQRRQMEDTLIQANELMERIFSSVNTLIAYMDRDFKFIRVNDTYARAGGYPPDFYIGRNHFDLYPHEENLAIFRRVVETGEPFIAFEKPFEYPEYPERGVTYWDWSLQPVKGGNGLVEGLVLNLVDVTGRKRAQDQLARQNQELLGLSTAERRQRELAESLMQATITLNKSLDLDQVLRAILEQVRVAIPFQGASIMLLEGECMRVAIFLGYEAYPKGMPAIGDTFLIADYPLLQEVYTSSQPVIAESVMGHPLWQGIPELEWVRAFLSVPLLVGGEVTGIITLSDEVPGAFDQPAADRLSAFAASAALALQNARMFEAESTARQFAETLSASAQALTRTLDLDRVIDTLLDYNQMIVHSDCMGVALLEDENQLSVRAMRGFGPWVDQDKISTFPINGSMNHAIRRVISTRKSLTFHDKRHDRPPEGQPNFEPDWNWLIVPIIASDKVIGTMLLGRVGEQQFNPELIQRAEALVSQGAAAIQNAWLFQQVRSGSERLQSLTHKLVEIQENERYLIARELHDEAGQALSLLKLNLGRLQQDPDCPQRVSQGLEELKGVADEVLEELHRLAVDLRPTALDHLGLAAALEQHARTLNTDRFSVRFKALGLEKERLSKDVEISLYRIGQEALANVVRHAQAKNVGILLERGEGWVKLFIEDDGTGFDPERPEYRHRLGLIGMRERAEMLGGKLTIESNPGKGTSIIVEVPDVDSHTYRR